MKNSETKNVPVDANEEYKINKCVIDVSYKQIGMFGLYNILQQDIALYDIRTKEQFEISHIKHAVNISDPFKLKQFESNRYMSFSIVIYGDNQSNSKDRLNYLYQMAASNDKENKLFVFDGIFNDFYNKYTFLCVDEESKQESFIEYPSMLLDQLFIGDAYMAQNNEIITNLQITHIVNVTASALTSFQLNKNIAKKLIYYQIKIDDAAAENIIDYFDKVCEFIDNVINEKGKWNKVLVHCMLGISRSSTICIAYLMKSKNYSLDDAYLLLKKARPRIKPNAGFWEQLTKYEQQIQQNKFNK
eukprot:294181_1